ncbi:MAG: PAS domain-containing sensor histidine kinase [Planctomycetes bacterium]|nr:PAS domain-containing sensor histidine kinase [Planctomycetota bacterium]MBL7038136.1 PAS domain-containing sensor histidine kinase [Pirellulaceae bacterium]
MGDLYQQYFDRLPCYLTVQDREFRVLHANERFRKDFGDIDGRYCYQVYKQRSEKCEVCPVEQTFWDGQCHRREERVCSLDGREVSVLVETTPIYDDDGKITSVIEMSTDVTHIKRLEEQLRQSQQRYQLLFEEVPCYISIQGPDLRMIEMNRAFQEDFGSALGALGCKCYEVYKHRTEECLPCPVRETFEDGEIHTREEVVTSLQGEQMNVLVTTAPIPDDQGRIVSVMEMSTNITAVRELESHLTSLGLLIGSVSHALKGLLNGLAGGMYLVETGFTKDKPDRVHKGWEIVKRNVERIKGMVSDILYYAKDREPIWETVSAAEVADEVCSLMQSRAAELGAKLASVPEQATGDFEADPRAVRSLLVNLVENSLDACRLDDQTAEHEVTLRVKGLPEHVRFEVQDNGIGMDRETREKVFSLFFSSKGTEGTGLGLFVANRIARAHGGTIDVESEVGVGTTFVVQLLRKRPPQESTDLSNCEKENAHG